MNHRMTLHTFFFRTVIHPLLFLLSCSYAAGQDRLPASAGTEFYTALPFLAIADSAEFLLTITPSKPTNVTLTFLEDNSSVSQFVASGQSWQVRIPREDIGIPVQQEINSMRSVQITSDEPVTVTATHDAPYFTDSWVVLPNEALGLDYRITSVAAENTLGGVFAVIATEDNTTVRITPTVTTGSGNSPGFTYGVTLNRGQVRQIIPSNVIGTDLSGTRVESDRPVVVLGGHAGGVIRPEIDATNPMVETFIPVHQWGTGFYGIPLPDRDSGYYKILAHRNNTSVIVNGTPIGTLDAGETFWHVDNNPVEILTSAPVQVAQFTQHRQVDTAAQDADPTLSLLQPTRSWTQRWLWTIPELPPRIWPVDTSGNTQLPFVHFLLLTAGSAPETPVLLNGTDVSAQLTTTYSDGKHRSGIIPLETGTYELISDEPVAAQLVGYNHFDAYFLPAGYAVPSPASLDSLVHETCAATLDTVLVFHNSRFDTVRIREIRITGLNGTVLSPGLPLQVLPFREQNIAVRFQNLTPGENNGTIEVVLEDGTVDQVDAGITIRRLRAEGIILEAPVLFPDATMATPVRDTTLHLVNTGDVPLRLQQTGQTFPFQIIEPALPVTLLPGDTLKLNVRFAPQSAGTFEEELVLLAEAPCSTEIRSLLTGKRTDPAEVETAVVDGNDILCPDEAPGTIRVRVYNRGGEPLTVQGASLSDEAKDDYALVDPPDNTVIPVGDSLTLTVLFNPTDTGMRRALLRILHDADPGFTLTPLGFRKDSVGADFADDSIRFASGLLCGMPSVQDIPLANTGTVPLTIDSVRFADGTYFSSSTSPGFAINSGESGTIAVAFAPGRTDILHDTLIVYGSPCDISARIPLSGAGLRTSLAVPDTLDFGSSPLCLLPDSLLANLVNDGGTADTITSVEVIGEGFAALFTGTVNIDPDEQTAVPVIFAPTDPGRYQAELVIRSEPCDLERRIVLRGTATSPSLATISRVEFQNVDPGEQVIDSTVLRNNGDGPLTIDSIGLPDSPPGLRILAPTFPATLLPGDSVTVIVTYDAETFPGEFNTTAFVYASPCSLVSQFDMRGLQGTPHLRLVLPHRSGNVNDRVQLPLRLIGDREYAGEVTLTATVRWNYRNLFPTGLTQGNEGFLVLIADSIAGEERIWTFRYEGPIPRDSLLGSIESLVLLGLADTTDILGTDVTAVESTSLKQLEAEVEPGGFKTLGICTIDGERFVLNPGELAVGKPRPNPGRENITLPIYAQSEGHVSIQIFDLAGRPVTSVDQQLVVPGENFGQIDVGRLPSGRYLVRLTFNGEQTDRHIIVRR